MRYFHFFWKFCQENSYGMAKYYLEVYFLHSRHGRLLALYTMDFFNVLRPDIRFMLQNNSIWLCMSKVAHSVSWQGQVDSPLVSPRWHYNLLDYDWSLIIDRQMILRHQDLRSEQSYVILESKSKKLDYQKIKDLELDMLDTISRPQEHDALGWERF